MRALVVVTTLTAAHGLTAACPATTGPDTVTTDGQPTTCMDNVDFGTRRHVAEATYTLGAGGAGRSGVGGAGTAYLGLDLGYAVLFGGDPEQPSYSIDIEAGGAVSRTEGAVDATGVATRGAVRIGPAQMEASVLDTGRGNIAFFPLTMEISHAGEIAGRPRISSRPELARGLYNRERVEVASRMLRVEGQGEKAQTAAPGLTEKREASAWAFDFITVHAGLDVAQQDGTRVDALVGGALMGVTDHSKNASLDVLGIEYRHIDAPMAAPVEISTVWVLKLDAVNPDTGTHYRMGWGEMLITDELRALTPYANEESGNLTIGAIGWFTRREWGGWGAQYRREPYVSMQGELGFEDRVSGEVTVPRALGLTARVFAARQVRTVDEMVKKDVTAGIEVDATYAYEGFVAKAGVELGRTYYTALDNAAPTNAGFGAVFDLSVQHSGTRTWAR